MSHCDQLAAMICTPGGAQFEATAWIMQGGNTEQTYAERAVDRSLSCCECRSEIAIGKWWWIVAWEQTDDRFEYGICSDCLRPYRVRARAVPRELWLRNMLDAHGAEHGRRWLGDAAADAWLADARSRRSA